MKTQESTMDKDAIYALWQLLRRTTRLIYKTRQKELDKYGISADKSSVLFTILRQGGSATPGAIARELFLEYHSVSEQLFRMEKDGLIRRLRETDGRSRVRVLLTKKGYSAYQKSARRKSIGKVFSVLSEEERKELWSMLAKLRETTMKQLKMESTSIYPPSREEELLESVVNMND
jgi:DNA-binding MarR family transcriptional regulator